MRARLIRWLLPLWLCWSCAAWANVPVHVVELSSAPSAMPAHQVEPTGQGSTRFRLGGPGKRPLWYAVSLTDAWQHTSPPLLVIDGNVLDRINVYVPPDYRKLTKTIFDASLDPAYSHHAVVYRLPSDLRAGQPIYVQVGYPRQRTAVWLGITDADAYRASDLQYVRNRTFFTSVQVSMVFVIVCFLIVLRDRMFLYFVVYASALVVFDMASSGALFAMPATAFLGNFGNRTALSMAALAAAFLLWFALEFADLRHDTPRLARWLAALRWPFLALAVVFWLPWLTPSWWPARIMNVLLILSTVLSLVAGWRARRRGNRQAGFFLLSWLPLLILTAARVVMILTKTPMPEWLQYGFPGSMAWAAVIITVGLADRMLKVRQERDHATHLAQFDPLTGVLNRRALMERLHAVWRTDGPASASLAVLFLDLDHFKHINDNRGHAAGDACLAAMTGAVRAELGDTSSLGRYGGEEFVVILRDDDARAARLVAERIVAGVAALRVTSGGHLISLTVSVGVANRDADTPSPEALVEMADTAQYRAKAEGRNRVVAYQPDLSATAPAG